MFLLEFLASTFFVSFTVAVVLMIFVYSGRKKLKQKLFELEDNNLEHVLSNGISDLSYGKAHAEAAFFVRKKWPEVKSAELQTLLRKHRRIEMLCYCSFAIAFLAFFVISLASVIGFDA